MTARLFTLTLPDDGIIDPVAVEIAARGIRPVALTRAERQLAAARILTRGGTPTRICQRLHVSGNHRADARCQKRQQRGGVMTSTTRARRRQRANAARQALALCEAEQLARPRISAAIARSALRAAGLPPHLAAALRRRIRLNPGQEAGP
jgi:hypothetical protein